MLRRTKTTLLNGKPLLDLPDRIVNVVHCEFDKEERAFYNGVQERVQDRVDKLEAAGQLQKAYTSMLVLLLRLRQGKTQVTRASSSRSYFSLVLACNHPSLLGVDYKKDQEAVEPKASKNNDDDEADELAALMGGLGLTKRCQFCQTE